MLLWVDNFRIQLLTHAVQALELVVTTWARIMQDTGQRVCIMRRELCVQLITSSQRLACRREIGYIRVRLACKYRIAVDAALLSEFDFRIPIRPFDQANRDTPADVTGQLC